MKDDTGEVRPPQHGCQAADSEQADSGGKREKGPQFKRGHSGNPRGRPRGAKNQRTIVREIAAEAHWVVEDGKRRRRATLDLILITIRNLAVEGDPKAFRALERCRERYGPKEPVRRGGYLIVPEGCRSLDEVKQQAAELAEWQRRLLGDWDPGKED